MYKLFFVHLLGSNPNQRALCSTDARCGSPTCPECCFILMQGMNQNVRYTWSCEFKMAGNCQICDHLAELCCDHAILCQELECSVPFCINTKQKLSETGARTVQQASGSQTQSTSHFDTRLWARTISADLRNRIIHELIGAIFPPPVPAAAMEEQRTRPLVVQARDIEHNVFEMADRLSQYYHMILDKIIEIRKVMEEKRIQRQNMDQNEAQN